MKISPVTIFYVMSALIVVALFVFAMKKSNEPSIYNSFAQCLSQKGVKMYGAWWCPHCLQQKKLFGNAFEKISYTECSDPGSKEINQSCKDAKIQGFPTWEFEDQSRLSGVQTFEILSEKSGCALP